MPLKKRISPTSDSAYDDEPNVMTSLPEFGSGAMPAPKKSFKWLPAIIILIVLILAGGVYMAGMNFNLWGKAPMKAVFLVNGQVYFGQLTRETSRDIYLNDVYYIQLQDQTDPTATTTDQAKPVQVPTLLKRGSEIHRPFGLLQLNRDQVVAIENVGTDSPIYQQIQQMEAPKK